MKCFVGLDIGAVSLKAAVLADGPLPARAELTPAGQVGGHHLYLGAYQRTRGRPIQSAIAALEQIIAAVGADGVRGVCLTGSAGDMVAQKLSSATVNEFKAVALGTHALGIKARTVFEMGGQTSKYLLLDPAAAGHVGYSIVDYGTNGDCAAGTGSFIDQQAGRLRYETEKVGQIALEAQRSAQVAGRCSVFAKSDMIHAQQKGYSPAEVLSGLCNAVARNFRMAVVRSHPVEAPVVFIGGLAANAAVVRSLREAFSLSEQDLAVPQHHAHVLAVGAAVSAATGKTSADWNMAERMDGLRHASDSVHGKFPTADPLSMERVLLLRDRVDPYEMPYGEKVDAYMGIDIGSVSTNVVLIDPEGNVIKDIYVRTKGRPVEVVSDALKDVAAELGARVVIRGVGTTGSGRELIGELVGADTVNDEITAHKTGATFIGQRMLNGRVPDTIFEIGGQDSKYISLQDGIVVDFTMNEACAAGTGSFLEERAEELDIAIVNEFAELALSSPSPIRLGERCTVFMERDVNDYLQRGASKADLVAGLAYSVVYNYINRVVRGRPIGDCIFFQGGTAYNDAVAAAFSMVLGKEVVVPPFNGVMGAIGSALLARDKMLGDVRLTSAGGADEASNGSDGKTIGAYVSDLSGKDPQDESRTSNIKHRTSKSRFRGYDMSKVDYKLREFTCAGCSNRCIMQEFTVEGEKTYWGDKCSDRYRKRSKSHAKPVIEDLFALRERLFNDESNLPPVPGTAPVVGIPRAMYALDTLPLWRTFWRTLGFQVYVSDPTHRGMVATGTSHVVAEPCFPVIIAHGHVAALLEAKVDWVFVPNSVSVETDWDHTESYLCPWNQTLPFVLRRAPAFEPHLNKFLAPNIQFRKGEPAVARALHETLGKKLGLSKARIAQALQAGCRAQQAFRDALLDAGRKALDTLASTGQPGIIITGRPYNVHDAGVNIGVGRKLRDFYGVNCIPIDFLDLSGIDITDVNDNMFWDYGRRVIAAAKLVSGWPNMHLIHITNFKCGPDSYVKHFIRTAGGKPYLCLQFDGHSNDAGMLTRCEAYLDSKGILRPWKKLPASEDATVLNG